MYAASRSSSAYKLAPEYAPQQDPKRDDARQKGKALVRKKKAAARRAILSVVFFFVIQLMLCYRWVEIYGLSSQYEKKEAELAQVTRANEQAEITLARMADASRVARYAEAELGMRKIEQRQVVYIKPQSEGTMQKVAKDGGSVFKRGIFGALSSSIARAVEYLK